MSSLRPLTPACYLDLLVPPVCMLPGGDELRDGRIIEDAGLPHVDLHMLSRLSLVRTEEEEAQDRAELMDEMCAREPDEAMLNSYLWKYPHEQAVLLPLKLTASGISRELSGPAQPPELIARPQFIAEERRLTGAERGTATHAALQGLDIDALRGLDETALHQSIVLQLNALTECGQLTPAMREAVRPLTLVRFFTSELGERMRRADVLEREWMFTLRMGTQEAVGIESEESLLVQGSVDCCFEEHGEWVLLDYKTDRTDDIDALKARYAPQLILYARALERITGKRVKEAWLCLLTQGTQHLIETA